MRLSRKSWRVWSPKMKCKATRQAARVPEVSGSPCAAVRLGRSCFFGLCRHTALRCCRKSSKRSRQIVLGCAGDTCKPCSCSISGHKDTLPSTHELSSLDEYPSLTASSPSRLQSFQQLARAVARRKSSNYKQSFRSTRLTAPELRCCRAMLLVFAAPCSRRFWAQA